MEDLLDLPGVQAVVVRVLRRRGREIPPEGLALDAELAEALTRELLAERTLTEEVRRRALQRVVGPDPAGLRALAWVVRKGRLEGEALMSWVARLPLGPSAPSALGEREAAEAVGELLRGVELPRVARVGLCVRVLASALIQEGARGPLLRACLAGPWFTPGDRRTLVEWAAGVEVVEDLVLGFSQGVPPAPVGLVRTALACMVEQGNELGTVVRYALTHLATWPDPRPVLMGLMDLLERFPSDLPVASRRQVLEVVRAHPEAALRRRAYQLAGSAGDSGLLREALRDADPTVRSWALSRLSSSTP